MKKATITITMVVEVDGRMPTDDELLSVVQQNTTGCVLLSETIGKRDEFALIPESITVSMKEGVIE